MAEFRRNYGTIVSLKCCRPTRYLAFQSVHNPYEDPIDSGVPGTNVVSNSRWKYAPFFEELNVGGA